MYPMSTNLNDTSRNLTSYVYSSMAPYLPSNQLLGENKGLEEGMNGADDYMASNIQCYLPMNWQYLVESIADSYCL